MDKPARVQIKQEEFPEEQPPQTGTSFNIWFQKWSGGGNVDQRFVKSPFKVNVSKDTGYTKGSKSGAKIFCLYFAKGCCIKGKKCEYLHRIPDELDIFDHTVDCFNREKFADYRDDMTGIGSFNHVNKTLYIGNLKIGKSTQDKISAEFGQFGKISKISVINNKNIAFVEFKNEANAQFAKEAMQGQTLGDANILSVKWANEDPNPQAVKEKKRKLDLETKQAVAGLLQRFEQSKKVKNVPEIEEPEEEQEEQEKDQQEENNEIKQIEAPHYRLKHLLNGSSLQKLQKLQNLPKSLVNYDSDSD